MRKLGGSDVKLGREERRREIRIGAAIPGMSSGDEEARRPSVAGDPQRTPRGPRAPQAVRQRPGGRGAATRVPPGRCPSFRLQLRVDRVQPWGWSRAIGGNLRENMRVWVFQQAETRVQAPFNEKPSRRLCPRLGFGLGRSASRAGLRISSPSTARTCAGSGSSNSRPGSCPTSCSNYTP